MDDVDDHWGILYARHFSVMVTQGPMRRQCSPSGSRLGSGYTSTRSPRGSTSSNTSSWCSRCVSTWCILRALYLRIVPASRARSSPRTMCCLGGYPSILGRTSTSSSRAGGSPSFLSRRTLPHSLFRCAVYGMARCGGAHLLRTVGRRRRHVGLCERSHHGPCRLACKSTMKSVIRISPNNRFCRSSLAGLQRNCYRSSHSRVYSRSSSTACESTTARCGRWTRTRCGTSLGALSPAPLWSAASASWSVIFSCGDERELTIVLVLA